MYIYVTLLILVILFVSDHLTGLINAAKEQNVTFVYALSPGLDITFSSSKEVTYLKRKLEQVSKTFVLHYW